MNLIAGIIWGIIAILKIIFTDNSNPNFLTYGWIILSVLYLGLYFVQRFGAYLVIEEDGITKTLPFPKQIARQELTQIKTFTAGYKLISDTKTISINTELINTDDLIKLQAFLNDVKLKTT
ncbi:hypothetical protein FNB79_07825 [Formosa sediminum]|uniref:Uncharacterized protein n=1 Tax=Formosa sediminum TaxID=2594004 RepID=A0A516GQU8_9FLAO|nr:hypothetical protein [Formosa sediminum]QDO93895.1 hypothetical protein FNB79_07825 [Formosa sediminum]